MLDVMLTALAGLCLLAAALPAVLALVNLSVLRTPEPTGGDADLVSILIPARDEAANIADAVRASLASTDVSVEVVVGDDHSTDATAQIVKSLADPRLRLVPVPDLPEGWTGKNHACAHIAAQANGSHLLFIDADVRLAPAAAAALAAHAGRSGAALVSGVPRQRLGSLGEMLTVPMINFLLLGYLPIPLMRARPDPALGAACGQLMFFRTDAYRRTGGHGALRASLHDGLRLPRILRTAGYRTDLVAAHHLATCRMYRGFAEAWAGFSKNAHEGLATPRALPFWTALLGLGQVLPPVLVGAGLAGRLSTLTFDLATAAFGLSLLARAVITVATRERLATVPLHPCTVLVALAIQWTSLLRRERATTAIWRGRSYPAVRP